MTTVINAAGTDTAMEKDKRYLCLVTIILICLKMGGWGGATLEKEKKTTWRQIPGRSAVINVPTSQTGLSMMFLSNGLIAQLILRPVLRRPPLMWKRPYFVPD